MYLFDSRNKAFMDDKVLQENIIIRFERCGQQWQVTFTTSTDYSFLNIATNERQFERIIFSDDSERFTHVLTMTEKSTIELSASV